jgi:leucine-rich repeat protein SHOC2
LDVRRNRLTKLPINIGSLVALTKLYLTNNDLTDLSLLRSLPTSTNIRFFGKITDRDKTKLSEWKGEWFVDPYCSRNKYGLIKILGLDRIFRDLAELSEPFSLDLSNLQLGEIPESVCNLRQIDRLNLFNNKLTELPNEFGNLSNLTHLDLRYNRLRKLPDSLTKLNKLITLDLYYNQLTELPIGIGNLVNLVELNLYSNKISKLPASIGNLSQLKVLDLTYNELIELPIDIGKASELTELRLCSNRLIKLPDSLGNLDKLRKLNLWSNQLSEIPNSIGNLINLSELDLRNNRLISLPDRIIDNINLEVLYLTGNQLTDLSILSRMPRLAKVNYLNIFELARKFWTKFSEWEPQWLLEENNAEIRRILIQQVGYEKICQELNTIELDRWREYTLLKIDDAEQIYDRTLFRNIWQPMLLLKMTCPSTAHIHILRVPPEMTSAEAAITWVNHGIHPDEFAIAT